MLENLKEGDDRALDTIAALLAKKADASIVEKLPVRHLAPREWLALFKAAGPLARAPASVRARKMQ